MNFAGAILTVIACFMVITLPARRAVLGVMLGICYITQGQVIDVAGFHFTAVRIILLMGFFRVCAKGELARLQMNHIDRVLILFAIVSSVMPGIRTGLWQESVGGAYNIFLSYFVFRALITNWEDVEELMTSMAVFILPLAVFMMMESATGRNVFDFMGGHEEPSMREGRYRCVGSFRGPHTSGTFGATLVPMFVGLYFLKPRRRAVLIPGLIAATVMTYTANASGPLMAYLSALVGLAFWRFRTNMKRVRQCLVGMLVLLGFTMKAPIWYVMAKLSEITGGDGWYRSYLMEQCWNHMSDWWLMGTNDTSTWAVTLMSWGGADLCNLFVSCAAGGGMACLISIILLMVFCFSYLGKALAVSRASVPQAEIIIWTLGASLFAHVMTLFSVTYFDQMHVVWWGLLGIISSASSSLMNHSSVVEVVEDHAEAPVNGAGNAESMASHS